MKMVQRDASSLLTMLLIVSLATPNVCAQRGGGGGGRAGGGGARAAGGARPSVNRSPSMSRPTPSRTPSVAQRPTATQRPQAGQRPAAAQRPNTAQRPTSGQRPNTSERPTTGQRPTPGKTPRPTERPNAGQVQDFLNLPKGDGNARPGTGRPAVSQPKVDRDKIQNAIDKAPTQRPDMPDWFKPGATPPTAGQRPAPGDVTRPERPGTGDRPDVRPPISERPGVRPPDARPPAVRPPVRPPIAVPPVVGPPRPWYPGHPHHPNYRPGYWWGWATAGAVTGWVAGRWTNPVYFQYGQNGNVYYENNVVYVNGEEAGSAEAYYQEAATIAESVPDVPEEEAEQMEWLPLGVFAITKEGVNASSMYLQLALSKDGVIAGTFYNESTGATHPVEGTVDEKTQRAAWKTADETNVDLVMETGIYNLTQDQAEVLVHYGPDHTETVLLVRLDESERPATAEGAETTE